MSEMINRCERCLAIWLRQAFKTAFNDAYDWSSIRVQPATDPRFGDFQCNDAMQIAKSLRRAPRAVAEAVLAAAPYPDFVDKAEIAGPGFINFTIKSTWLATELAQLPQTTNLGIPNLGQAQTIVMDYSSPNVAKPMHIGHIRSTVIGNALDRMYRALGYQVIADNHLGDWGTQFGLLIQGYRHFLNDAERANLSVEALERVYVASYERSQSDPKWLEQCKAELVKLQQGEAENRAIWQRFIEISRQEFERIYQRLDIQFDYWRGESFYNDMLAETVELLQTKKLATESEGALVVHFEAETLPLSIVRKSDGGFNYTTTDIATVRQRVAEFNPARIVYVTDERQQLHFKQFFNICRQLGYTTELEHIWFGLMRLPEGTFSTRQGNVIKLEVLLDEAEKRALAIIQAGEHQLSATEQKELAAAIGIGAIKYADLSHDPQTMIVFTWEKALSLEGNSGPYLQYAHARICSLLDKYTAQYPAQDPLQGTIALESTVEKELALRLLKFPDAVVRAAEAYKPSILADYLFGLAQLYSSFYQRSPVLKAPSAVRASRIHLCVITAQVLAQGLDLLGIQAPRRI